MTTLTQNTVGYRESYSIIRLCIEDKIPLIIIGNPGIGKTSIVRQVASEAGVDCSEILGYLYEPVDFRGLLVPNTTNNTTDSYSLCRWPLERLTHGTNPMFGKRGVLLLDEMLNAHRDVLTAFAEPLCDRTVNGDRIADGWSIIATGNHIGGGTSAGALPSHVVNRASIIVIQPTWNEWVTWAHGRVRPELIAYFSMSEGLDLFSYDPSKIIPNTPYLTPRSLENLSKRIDAWYRIYPNSKPPLHIYSSMVGEYGGKLYSTLDYIDQLVPYPEIEANPHTCRTPACTAAIYAQIQILAAAVAKKKKIIPHGMSHAVDTFISRLGRLEIQAAAHFTLMKVTDGWASTAECTKFVNTNQHLT